VELHRRLHERAFEASAAMDEECLAKPSAEAHRSVRERGGALLLDPIFHRDEFA
jgi:hypothetical protein